MKATPAVLGLLVTCALASGCAPLRPNYRFQAMGAADPARDRRVSESMEDVSISRSNSVTVLVDTIPDGIDIHDGVIRVRPGYQHQIIGKVAVTANHHVSFISLLGFPDYATSWRKPYCYPQTILTYATLSLWAFLVPLAYPCYGEVGIREEDAVDDLKRAAFAAGGDTVLASFVRGDDRIYRAIGIVLRIDPQVRTSAPRGGENPPERPSDLPAGGTSL